jgi:hypothetical protein
MSKNVTETKKLAEELPGIVKRLTKLHKEWLS